MTVEPVNPVQSVDPAEAMDPVAPVAPVETVAPAESAAPAEPHSAEPHSAEPGPSAAANEHDPTGGDGERTERCPSCGAPYRPQDSFCEACGTELAPAALSSGTTPPAAGRACPLCRTTQISADGYCDNCGHKLPTGRDHQELDLGTVAGITDRGHRHHRNEDAMALAAVQTRTGPVALAVVCDGVSTSDRPDEASLAAAQAAARVLLSAVRGEENLRRATPWPGWPGPPATRRRPRTCPPSWRATASRCAGSAIAAPTG
jgi:Double zinc ribbon